MDSEFYIASISHMLVNQSTMVSSSFLSLHFNWREPKAFVCSCKKKSVVVVNEFDCN